MRKIYVLGLALLAVFAFGAVVATAAMAELPNVEAANEDAFWLVKGTAISNGEANARNTEWTGEIIIGNLNSGVEVKCSYILLGTMYNLSSTEATLEGGFGLVKSVVDLGGVTFKGLEFSGMLCSTAKPAFCENNAESPLVWPDGLPWLTTLHLMTLDSEEKAASLFLMLFSADPTSLMAYETKCLLLGATIEELCEGESSADLELMAGTPNSLLAEFIPEELELEKLEATCNGTANVEFQNGSIEVKLEGSTEELDASALSEA